MSHSIIPTFVPANTINGEATHYWCVAHDLVFPIAGYQQHSDRARCSSLKRR